MKMVIIPSVEYKLQGIPCLNTSLEKLESIIRKFIKHGLDYPHHSPLHIYIITMEPNITSIE